MLSGPRFARVAYTMFAVAVLAAFLKLGVSSAEPLFLRTLPTEPVARKAEAAEPPPAALPATQEIVREVTQKAVQKGAPSVEIPEQPNTEGARNPASLAERLISRLPARPASKVPYTAGDPAAGDPTVEAPGVNEQAPAADGQSPDVIEQTSTSGNDSDGTDAASRALGAAARAVPEPEAEPETAVPDDAPVFYRPSLEPGRFASPSPAVGSGGDSGGLVGSARGVLEKAPSSEPVCGNLGDFPRSSRAVFPLPAAYRGSYADTWGAPRSQGGHEGTDLMSPTGTGEFAITDGTIVPVAGANANGWNTLGGYTVMLQAARDVGPIKRGDLFYYAHMDRESTLPVGTRVRAGHQVGVVGDTGEGLEVTRGRFPSHLHFGWYDTGGGRASLPSGAMNPYPLLKWLEGNGGSVRGGTDAAYCEAPQGPIPIPSTGTGGGSSSPWPTSDALGERPDISTGNEDDARPSPVVPETEAAQSQRPDQKDPAPNATAKPNDEPQVPVQPDNESSTVGSGQPGAQGTGAPPNSGATVVGQSAGNGETATESNVAKPNVVKPNAGRMPRPPDADSLGERIQSNVQSLLPKPPKIDRPDPIPDLISGLFGGDKPAADNGPQHRPTKKDPVKPGNVKPQTEKPKKDNGPKQLPVRPAPKPQRPATPAGEKPPAKDPTPPGPVGDQYGVSAVGEMISEVEREARKTVVKDPAPEPKPRPPASNPKKPGVVSAVPERAVPERPLPKRAVPQQSNLGARPPR